MELVPTDSNAFRSAVEALKEYLPQAQLCISAEGLRIHGMDVSHVGCVDYFLSATDCSVLTVSTPVVIGMNMTILARVLSSVGTGETVTLGYKKEKLLVSYSNEKAAKKAVYEMSTLDIDIDGLDLPSDIQYGGTIVAKTVDVSSVFKEVGQFGDSIQLCLDEEGFHISSTGDFGHVKQTLENTEGREMTLMDDSASASFGTKYLTGILKGGAPLANTVQIDFDAGQPLRASFRFGQGSHYIVYMAPKLMDV